jgi:hypothetical protein
MLLRDYGFENRISTAAGDGQTNLSRSAPVAW